MKIDSILQMNNISIPVSSDALSSLNIGDVIKAKIVEMSSKELTMKLFDGTVFTAALANAIDAKPGDYLTLLLKARLDSQLIMEPVNSELIKPEEESAPKLLMNFGIKPDQTSLDIIKEMQSSRIPLTKELFLNLLDAVKNIKELTPSKAVFLYSHDADFTKGNADALNQLVEGKFKLGSEMEQISRLLEDIIKQESQTQSTVKNQQPSLPGGLEEAVYSFSEENRNVSTAGNVVNSNTTDIPKHIADILSRLSDGAGDLTILKEEIYKLIENGNLLNVEEDGNPELLSMLNSIKGSNDENSNNIRLLLEKVINAGRENNLKSDETGHQPLKAAEDETGAYKERDMASIKRELDSLFLDISKPDIDKDSVNLRQLYRDMLAKLSELKEAVLSSRLPENPELLNRMDNIENNIRFMNEIYNNSVYIQIPVRLPERNGTAELYILKKGSKRKRIDPENFTMLIALNTNNMGTVETLVSLRGKSINLNIRVENEKVMEFFKENHTELYESLKEKGYRLADIRYCIIDEGINVMNVEKVVKKVTVGNSSIDYKI